jgi:hypothetical protein
MIVTQPLDLLFCLLSFMQGGRDEGGSKDDVCAGFNHVGPEKDKNEGVKRMRTMTSDW